MPASTTAPLTALLLLLAPLAAAQDSAAAPAGSMPPAAAAAPAADTTGGLTFGQVLGLLAAAGVVGGGGFAAGKARRVTVEPQPLTVEVEEKFATKAELATLRTRHEAFEKEIRALIRASEERSHSRMDIISSKLDRLIGLVEGMQSLNRP